MVPKEDVGKTTRGSSKETHMPQLILFGPTPLMHTQKLVLRLQILMAATGAG